MKTVILDQPGALRLAETEAPPALAEGEALVRIRRVGICGTDLHAYRGRQPFFSYPRILGHELGVEVVEARPASGGVHVALGEICAVEPYLNCGECGPCRRGKTNCCEQLRVLGVHTDGGMREYITVPISKLHKTRSLSVDQLALVEMLCIGAHAVRRAQLERDEPVLVIGAGPIGLASIAFARAAGADVAVVEVSDRRRAFCQEQLGVENMIAGGDGSTVESALRAAFGGDLPNTVFDATGNRDSMQQAFSYVGNGGKLVFVGLVQAEISFLDPEFHRREITLLSSRNATGEDFAHVIRSMEDGSVKIDAWITDRTSSEAIADEFPRWLDPANGTVKAMLEF